MNLPTDPLTIGAGAATVAATMATAVKLVWNWLTKLIESFQDEAKAARQEFLAEAKAARTDFLAGLQRIEDRRQASEEKLMAGQGQAHETLLAIHTILQERGVPAPATQGATKS